MRAKDLINYAIPPLKPTDDIEKALAWMTEFHISELPVIGEGNFLGFFNENLLFDEITEIKTIGELHPIGTHVFVDQNEHYYEVLKKAYDASSSLVGVTNESGKYIGVVAIQDVVEAFSKMSSIHSPGTILVLTMDAKNYSMTEISRIVESEGGKILSSFLENIEEKPGDIRITLKTNMKDSNSVISAMERFGYHVSSTFGQESSNHFEQERLDTLMRYLKI